MQYRTMIKSLLLMGACTTGAYADINEKADNPGDFEVSVRSSFQSRVSLGINRDDGHYLITWSDIPRMGADVDIYGRILDTQGRAVSNDIGISTGIKGQAVSAVAFDNINKRYLVAWSDWRDATAIDSDIYGQFINTDGSLYGKNFVISENRAASQKDVAVAFDPARGQYLVAWKHGLRGGLEKLRARYIHANGNPLGEEFYVAKGEGKQDRPSLYYDPKRKRFLAMWRDIVNEHLEKVDPIAGKGIFSQFIDPAKPHKPTLGKLIDAEDEACLPTSLYAAAYSPDADVFLVSWTTGRDYQKLGLDAFGAIIDAGSGEQIAKPFAIARTNDYQEFPAVTYDRHNKRFLAVWYDLRRDRTATNADIYGRFVSTAGKMGNEFLISDLNMRGARRYPVAVYDDKHNSYLVFWQDQRHKTDKKSYARIYGKLKSGTNN